MKYWVYMNGEVPGSYAPEELVTLPGFQASAMVCPAEGGIEERNWRRAGQFEDILKVLHERKPLPPYIPLEPDVQTGPARSPDDVLNDASTKIFGHVTELMKELENRREEKALSHSLQRQLIDLKNELQALRERNTYLQERVDLLPEFQKRENKLEEKIHQLENDSRAQEDRIAKLTEKVKVYHLELEQTRRSEKDFSEDVIRQTHLNDELSKKLGDKEFQLARTFGIISKLEAMLGDILPGATSGMLGTPRAEKGDDVDISESGPEQRHTPYLDDLSFAQVEAEAPKQAGSTPKVVVPEPSDDDQETEPVPPAQPITDDEIIEEIAEPPAKGEGRAASFTTDTEMTALKPDWPDEGELRPISPPWKTALKRMTGLFKKRLKGSETASKAFPPTPSAPSEATEPPDSSDEDATQPGS